LLTIKATSQAALISMQEALGMLQEIVEGTNASQQAPQAPSRQRKSSHKFLRPLSPHRKGSRSSKGSKKGEALGSPMVVTAANSSRQSINSSASCQAADPDQVSVASETSSSFHDSLASWPTGTGSPASSHHYRKQLSPRSLRKHLATSVKFVSLLTGTQSRPSSPSRKTAADQRHPDQDRNTPSPSLVVPPPSPMLGSHRPKKWLPKWHSPRLQKTQCFCDMNWLDTAF